MSDGIYAYVQQDGTWWINNTGFLTGPQGVISVDSGSTERPPATSFPIARLRYTAADRSWTLYWRDRNLRSTSTTCSHPSSRVDDLLSEIDRDPTCIFWG